MKELLQLLDPLESTSMVIRIDRILKQEENNEVVISYREYLKNSIESISHDRMIDKAKM